MLPPDTMRPRRWILLLQCVPIAVGRRSSGATFSRKRPATALGSAVVPTAVFGVSPKTLPAAKAVETTALPHPKSPCWRRWLGGSLALPRCLLLAVGIGLSFTATAADTNNVSTNGPVTDTPAQPQILHFQVRRYEVLGNTLLPQKVLDTVLAKHTGENVTFSDVATAVKELQLEYHNRGWDTISVTIPQQKLTNGIFKIKVFQGRLAEIVVVGNRYFSSNNILNALPGLRTNIYMNSKYLQPQLDMANANQDRQIYPEIHPGPDPDTTSLTLRVKDHLPIHAKVEANNNSTPGTPDMRLATSAVCNNMWQLDHSFGVQYTFSEEDYKEGGDWHFFDKPQVANYSAFYRLPLGAADSFADQAALGAGKFGYNEATRRFVLPPASGAPELNLFASGSTIDSGITTGTPKNIFTGTNGSTIDQQTIKQNLTLNNDMGLRFSKPIREFDGIRSHLQAGMDYKNYNAVNFETNNFIYTQFLVTQSGAPFTRVTTTPSPVPATKQTLGYLPLTFRWDATRDDASGISGLGLNYSPNTWYTGNRRSLDGITGSSETRGFWQIISGNVTREQSLPNDWKVALKVDGQWASEPLVSNEEFGGGGIAGVRGYREGEVFGDDGWRTTSELKLPPFRVGYAGEGTDKPLTVRASFFMDYADTYLIDPLGRRAATPLWGTGLAGAASFGSHFNGLLSFGWPLLGTPSTEAHHVRIAFSLSAQF